MEYYYNLIAPKEVKIGDCAYFEGDLPQRTEDFHPVTRIERNDSDYLFYQESVSPFPYPIEADVLVFTLPVSLAILLCIKNQQSRPKIVCLCGSTRFSQAFQDANLYETLAGNIVLSIGCNTKSDDDLIRAGVAVDKEKLDTLHLWKIDLADEVLILNVGGYVGESTKREIEYAKLQGKAIRWLEVL